MLQLDSASFHHGHGGWWSHGAFPGPVGAGKVTVHPLQGVCDRFKPQGPRLSPSSAGWLHPSGRFHLPLPHLPGTAKCRHTFPVPHHSGGGAARVWPGIENIQRKARGPELQHQHLDDIIWTPVRDGHPSLYYIIFLTTLPSPPLSLSPPTKHSINHAF